jgi:hypothetical protein
MIRSTPFSPSLSYPITNGSRFQGRLLRHWHRDVAGRVLLLRLIRFFARQLEWTIFQVEPRLFARSPVSEAIRGTCVRRMKLPLARIADCVFVVARGFRVHLGATEVAIIDGLERWYTSADDDHEQLCCRPDIKIVRLPW